MNPLIGFVFLFLTLQNIAIYFEVETYFGMIDNIQNKKTSYMDDKCLPSLKILMGYFPYYLVFFTILYYLILKRKGSAFEGFLLGAGVAFTTDNALWTMFDRTFMSDIPTLIYDVLITGGLVTLICVYIFNSFSFLLINYWHFFSITFALSFIFLIHKVCKFEKKLFSKIE